jgi:outer membrane protein TolC
MTTLTTALLALSLAQAPQTLTLEDALKRADEVNLDLKAAQARVGVAKAGVWKAWSYHLLQVSAQGSVTVNDREAALTLPTGYGVVDRGTPQPIPDLAPPGVTATNYLIVPTGLYSATIQAKTQKAAMVQATLPLFAPQAWFGIQAALRAEDATVLSVEQARRDVLFGVAQAYYAVASLKRLVDVSQQLYEIAERQSKDATIRYKAGTVAKVARLRADMDFARADQDLLRSRNSYQSARLSLAILLDRQPDFEVVEPPEPVLPADVSGLEAGALDNRPDVQAARMTEGVYASQRRISATRYLPTIAGFGRATYSDPVGLTGQKEAWAVGLLLNWTILDGGLREAELRETSARISEAEANRRNLENRARAEVRLALFDLESARANATKAREQRDLAVENQRLVDVSFKAGAATAVEQADATAGLRNAEIQLATETLQAQLAAVRVMKAAGTFDPVKAVHR